METENDLQIIRGNYFYRDDVPKLTLYDDMLIFNNCCVNLLKEPQYVNILVSNDGSAIHIRGCRKYDFNSVKWYNLKGGQKRARRIRSRMLTAMLFERIGYDYDHKYVLSGEYRENDVPELVFYSDNPQVFIISTDDENHKRFKERYPKEWRESFGIPVSQHEDHKLRTFEEYVVMDVTLEKVVKVEDRDSDEEAERLKELKEKYVKEGSGYYG